MKSKLNVLFGAVLLSSVQLFGQVYSNKEVGQKNQELADSIKTIDYPYALPIWGEKAAKLGFNLPYSAGLGVNYLWQRSDIVINNLFVGFNNSDMIDLDEVVRFDNSVSEAQGVNLRPDIWLFPFLNVYGVFGKAKTSTSIGAGLWIPDADNQWNEILSFSSKANFDATTFGLGMTPTIGVGGGWLALDMNMTWTDIAALEKPAFAFVFGPRLGKSFKLKNKDSNIAFWAGGFRLHLKSSTMGSLNFNELFPVDGLQEKVDAGIVKVGEAQTNVDTWWNGLTPIEQKNPVNKAKYATANRTIAKAGEVLNGMDAALNDDQNASVQYSLAKRPKDMWNFILGTQYQINKHIMLRGEYGFLGSRQQFIGGLQYRFGM
jgi:opacity protein-like surface antigen